MARIAVHVLYIFFCVCDGAHNVKPITKMILYQHVHITKIHFMENHLTPTFSIS